MSSDGEEGEAGDLFAEPEGFYQAEKQPTFVSHKTLDGKELSLRLVGSSPLWVGGHYYFFSILVLPFKIQALYFCAFIYMREPLWTVTVHG